MYYNYTTNWCLAYQNCWYQYRPKFFNWLLVFLEKACCYSCCYLFVSLQHCIHMSLSYLLSDDDGLIFSFFVLWNLLRVVLLCLKSKKQKRSNLLSSLMASYHRSYLHAYLCQNFSVNG